MITSRQLSPAHQYVVEATQMNRKLGHENLGFLSFEKGLMPLYPPLEKLPPAFEAWDILAQNLPIHYKNQNLRSAIKALPILLPNANNLPEEYLCRASMVLSIFAHAYVRNEREEDLDIPDSITLPWKIVTERLGRPQPFLSYIDLILYNWKFKTTSSDQIVENLQLLTPTVNNQEEQVFYLTQTEIAFKTKAVLQSIITIQDAIINNEKKQVIEGVQTLKKIIAEVTKKSFLKINPNPRSATYVDPVVWAKTVAPFAVPLKEGVQGPSGTSSPFFHILDTFLERNKYQTILGKEALFIREWYPMHWKRLLSAMDQVSLSTFMRKVEDPILNGAFYDLMETYSGDSGFLGVHKRKVYGYLQMAFKVGRSVTIGGFSGLFKERTWEEVDAELEKTRLERYDNKQLKCPYSGMMGQTPIANNSSKQIVLDTSSNGLQYQPGDRCAILPKNQKDKIAEILELADCTGNEEVHLNTVWKQFFAKYYNQNITTISIAQFLQHAILKDASKVLDQCNYLKNYFSLDNGSLSLFHLLKQCKTSNVDIKPYLIPNLADILSPETERMYSISSGFHNNKMELTVGAARTVIDNVQYEGVASSYLHSAPVSEQVSTRIISPLRFSLPQNDFSKIYLFAGGTGIAPFKGFWEVLEKQNKLSKVCLFYCVKKQEDILYKKELLHLFLHHHISLHILLTRSSQILDIEASKSQCKLVFKDTVIDKKDKLASFISQIDDPQSIANDIIGNKSARHNGYFYMCGKAGFALNVMQFLKTNLRLCHYSEGELQNHFLQLFADDRIKQDIFTSPSEISAKKQNQYFLTDIIAHNSPERGYWVALNDKVYDLTEFKDLHPGGDKIIADNAGRDATHEFTKAGHHLSKEITSMLSIYCIGNLKKVDFTSEDMKLQYEDWVSALHLVTEMTNTFHADHSYLDKSITIADGHLEKTQYKLAILKENQKRFSTEYTTTLCQIFRDLFFNHSSYSKFKAAFDLLLTSGGNWDSEDLPHISGKPYVAKSSFNSTLSNSSNNWDALEMNSQKNLKILEIVRAMLSQMIQLFESDTKIYSQRFEKHLEIALQNTRYELQTLAEITLTPA